LVLGTHQIIALIIQKFLFILFKFWLRLLPLLSVRNSSKKKNPSAVVSPDISCKLCCTFSCITYSKVGFKLSFKNLNFGSFIFIFRSLIILRETRIFPSDLCLVCLLLFSLLVLRFYTLYSNAIFYFNLHPINIFLQVICLFHQLHSIIFSSKLNCGIFLRY